MQMFEARINKVTIFNMKETKTSLIKYFLETNRLLYRTFNLVTKDFWFDLICHIFTISDQTIQR